MTIAVLGAGGATGEVFVEAALSRGHSVRAGVHRRHRLGEHKRLELMYIDACEYKDVSALLLGADVVVSLIGHTKGSDPLVQSKATAHVIRAMHELGQRRVVSLTGTAVRSPGDMFDPIEWAMNAAITLIDPKRIADGRQHAEVLRHSRLEWTVLRVLKLTTGRAKGFSLRAHAPAQYFSPRIDVARAILKLLESRDYGGTLPVMTAVKHK